MITIKANYKNKFSELSRSYKTSKRLLLLLWSVDKGLFVGSFVFAGIPAILPFVNAYVYKLIIDLIINATNGAPFNIALLTTFITIRIFSLFLQDVAFSLQEYYDKLLWTKFPVYLYQIVLEKLSSLDVSLFEDSSFKDKLEKVKESYQWKPLNMLSNLFYGFQNLLQLAIALVAIATLNWIFIIIVLIVAIPAFINQSRQAKFTWGIWNDNSPHRKKFWYLSDLIQDGKSVKEIKIFQTAKRFLADLKEIYLKQVKDNTANAKNQLKVNILFNALNVAVYIGTEIYIIFSAISRSISVGDITYYTTVLNNFQNGISGLFRNVSRIFDNSLYIKDMFEVLDIESRIKEVSDSISIDPHIPHSIEFRNVTFTYPGANEKIFDNFSLTILPGQKIALVGENGAGKTTLIKLLARFYDVDSGEILIDGINLKNLKLDTWYKTLGILFQDFIKYEYSLKDNIYFGKVFEKEDLEEIKKAAHMSGADNVAEKLPRHYNQMLGKTFEGGIDLSTGQWQKVALARGFLRDAPILILDEPTAAIDAKAESEIFEKVESLSKDKTVIIISHRFSTVRNADKIYVIDRGKIKEEGTHEELLEKDGTYAKLFKLQAKGYQ